MQASQTLAQTPPSCALGQSPPGVWFSCSVGGDIVAGSWRTEMIFEEQPPQCLPSGLPGRGGACHGRSSVAGDAFEMLRRRESVKCGLELRCPVL